MTAARNWPKTAILSGYVTFPFVIVFQRSWMDTVRLRSRLFSLCWIRKGLHLKNMLIEPSRAIYRGPCYGPTFSGGHDIYIGDNANQNTNSYTIQLWHPLLSSEWSYRPFYIPSWNRLLFTWRGWGILSLLNPYSWRSYVTIFFLIIWKALKIHWNNRKSWNNGSVLFKITLLLIYLNFYVCFFSFPWLGWKRIVDG